MAKSRNYRREYDMWHSSTKSKKDRASRNKARRQLEKEGRVHKGDGRDVDHVNGRPRDGRRSNLRVTSRSYNRSKK
jgi:hypothetical protein